MDEFGNTKRKLKFISSWDDGAKLDLKLAALLLKYDLPAIFYLTSTCELTDSEIDWLSHNGFEIGGHTITHPMDLKLLSDSQLKDEIEVNKHDLESIINKPITKFCYPRGRYDERAIEICKAAGYKSARTTKVLETDMQDNYREGTTIHCFDRKEYNGKDWENVARAYTDFANITDGTFHIWGHSWEIEQNNEWEKLERVFKHLTENYEIVNQYQND